MDTGLYVIAVDDKYLDDYSIFRLFGYHCYTKFGVSDLCDAHIFRNKKVAEKIFNWLITWNPPDSFSLIELELPVKN